MPSLDVVEARVRRDAIEPGSEGEGRVVLVERPVGADERFLRAVSRGIRVVRYPQRDVVHASSVSLDQSREGFGLSRETPLDGLLVGARHGAPAPPSWAPCARCTQPSQKKFRVSWDSRWT